MLNRVDSATLEVNAPPDRVYQAFASAEAMTAWLPPTGMTGAMLAFDFREGGGYQLRLTYAVPGRGKTTADADEVTVRFTSLVPGERIEQAVVFESDDPAFAGEMRMAWSFEQVAAGTRVTVRCEDVPAGITAADHEAGLASTLGNLAAFVERGAGGEAGLAS